MNRNKGGSAGLDAPSLLRLRMKFRKEGRGRDGINESVVAAIRG